MYQIICITNRTLCEGDFEQRIRMIAESPVSMLILREKDLSPDEYTCLARKVVEICRGTDTQCILHSFVETAVELNHPAIHLPMSVLRTLSEEQRKFFTILGASCHSLEEAEEAESLGCTYITASHIFSTDCKKDLAPKGLSFLCRICRNLSIPVYGLGGIHPNNISSVINAGADGVCIMSDFMQCKNIREYRSLIPQN